MSYELDHTEWNKSAKHVCTMLEEQRRRISRTESDITSQSRVSLGIQRFKQERRDAVELLKEWIGHEEAREFDSLPVQFISQHPARLTLEYHLRNWAAQEVKQHSDFLKALIQRIREGAEPFE